MLVKGENEVIQRLKYSVTFNWYKQLCSVLSRPFDKIRMINRLRQRSKMPFIRRYQYAGITRRNENIDYFNFTYVL